MPKALFSVLLHETQHNSFMSSRSAVTKKNGFLSKLDCVECSRKRMIEVDDPILRTEFEVPGNLLSCQKFVQVESSTHKFVNRPDNFSYLLSDAPTHVDSSFEMTSLDDD